MDARPLDAGADGGAPLEELLAHSGWLAALARRLIADAGAADDLVQDTWTAVLARRARPAGDVRAWLAAVMRNLLRDRARSVGARRRREERTGRERTAARELPTPDELAAALEGQKLLVDALRELGEPYRATILLHYHEGLSSAEIARRLATPEGTVRWRLKHGLDELRARLDARTGGERRRWCLLLAPLARRHAVAAAGGATALVALLLLAAAVGIGAWGYASRSPAGTPANEPTRVTSPTEPSPERTAASPSGQREPVTGAASQPARGLDSAPDVAGWRLRARLFDEDGRALGAARLGLLEAGVETSLLEIAWASAQSDGSVELVTPHARLASAVALYASAHAPGHARVVVRLSSEQRAEAELDLGELLLPCGGDVVGTVVTADGEPLAGALLLVSRALGAASAASADARRLWPVLEPLAGPFLPLAASDARGRFELIGVPCGSFALVVRAAPDGPALLPARVEPLVIGAGERTDVGELVLAVPDPAETITGRVTDEAGESLAGIALSLGDGSVNHPGGAVSRADGSFTLLAPRGGSWIVSARDPLRRWSPADVRDVASGARDVLVRLQAAPATSAPPPTPALPGPRVSASAGDAELRGRFLLAGEAPGSWLVRVGSASTQLDARGAFVLRGLQPGNATLSILSGYGGDVELHFAAECTLASGRNVWELDLPAATVVLAKLPEVARAAGEPVGEDTPEFLLQATLTEGDVVVLFQELAGRERTLARLPSGRWTLSCRAPGFRFGGEARWSELVGFGLRGGETRRVVLP